MDKDLVLATLDYGDDPSEPLICKFPSSERPRPRWVSPEAWVSEIIEMYLVLEKRFAEDEFIDWPRQLEVAGKHFNHYPDVTCQARYKIAHSCS